MDINQCCKNQKASREIEMEYKTGEPWTRNKERNTTGNEDGEICKGTPRTTGGRRSFAFSIVTGHPEILRGVHHCEDTRAVAALRDPESPITTAPWVKKTKRIAWK